MAKTIQEERWRWIKPIIHKDMKLIDVARVCPHSELSLKRRKKSYRRQRINGLIPKSTEPKSQPSVSEVIPYF